MNDRPYVVLTVLLGLFMSASSYAEERIKIARLEVSLPKGDWKTVDAPDLSLSIDQGAGGYVPGKAKAFVLRDETGSVLATLLIGSTWGQGNVRPNGTCPPHATTYVRDYTSGRMHTPECVRFGGPFPSSSVLATALKRLRHAKEKSAMDIPERGYALLAYLSVPTGSYVVAEGIFAPNFVGIPGAKAAATLPPVLPESAAAWADAFGEAVRKANLSIGGELVIPDLSFAPAVNTSQPTK